MAGGFLVFDCLTLEFYSYLSISGGNRKNLATWFSSLSTLAGLSTWPFQGSTRGRTEEITPYDFYFTLLVNTCYKDSPYSRSREIDVIAWCITHNDILQKKKKKHGYIKNINFNYFCKWYPTVHFLTKIVYIHPILRPQDSHLVMVEWSKYVIYIKSSCDYYTQPAWYLALNMKIQELKRQIISPMHAIYKGGRETDWI